MWFRRLERDPSATPGGARGPGECWAWPGGVRDGHCVKNVGTSEAVLLAMSNHVEADHGEYPELDLKFTPGGFTHRDGQPY